MIRLLISDDSAFMRIAIRKMVEPFDDIQVVGEAKTGLMCVELAEQLRPDVITMDVEMPVMDGLEATRQIMARCPCPIIMLSSLTERNSVTTIRALENGAVDFIAKKSSFVQLDIVKIGEDLVEKLRYWGARRTRVALGADRSAATAATASAESAQLQGGLRTGVPNTRPSLVVVGISTGGPATLPTVLKSMRKLACPLVVAQHMPPMFTSGFARHLRAETGHDVVESTDGLELRPGLIVIARGGADVVVREGLPGTLYLFEQVDSAAPIHPNADVLFRSSASISGHVAAVVMTGMGSDGLSGAGDLVRKKNAHVIAQSPATCIVEGMPSMVISAGLASAVLTPEEIGLKLTRMAHEPNFGLAVGVR